MDREGFRELLKTRKLSEEKISASIALAERFESFIDATGGQPNAETTWTFCKILVQEGQNTYDNLLAVARYGRFTKNNDVYVAVLELLDGAEAQPNLYQKVGEMFGESVRDEVFSGIGISPLGKPSGEKPQDMFPVIERLFDKVGQEERHGTKRRHVSLQQPAGGPSRRNPPGVVYCPLLSLQPVTNLC